MSPEVSAVSYTVGEVVNLAHASVRTLAVRVRDDGVGMASGTAPGFGLTGMSERVRALAGEVRVGNAEGGGVLVEATAPAW